jgi:hypothetical protein
MTRHESLIPRPKTTGPSVPAEKVRMLKFEVNQTKKILWYPESVCSSTDTGTIPIR